ncbi:MAG TPA: T9SS type A sorting domain-containing protein, partial [Chitinophagaceae bacterium]|nr:T9SS type A sorting domain-containing protein [Chitinophagaceae bacterium]
NGSSWQLISNSIDLTKGYYKWNAPDTFATALLRMTLASQNFQSDTFTISKRMNTFVGFNCSDSFLFFWNRIPGVSTYQVYRLGDKYMEPLFITNDTVAVLGKQANPSLYYAVAPVLNTKTAVRSYGFDYSNQGVGCYIKNFIVSLNGATGSLELELGILYKIRSVTWEKLSASGYNTLQTISTVNSVLVFYNDNSLSYGVNTYRVKIELQNGQIIYSQPESLYYFGNRNYIIYPNPAEQYQPVTILLREPQPTLIQVFNSAGVQLYQKMANDITATIPAGILSKGFFIIRLSATGKTTEALKLVVY